MAGGARIRGGWEELERFQKALAQADKMRVKVGILGQKSQRNDDSGETNAEIGAKMEFGFVIPEGPFKGVKVASRSFLRYPLSTMVNNITTAFKQEAVFLLKRLRVDLLFKRLGILGVKAVDYAFQTRGMGMWKPNSPVTIILKGSDSPLIDTGQLRRSISYQVTEK